ncbi:hypothetical protein BCR41DRAFT_356675 [Lobosporangium transversale]|uniref:Uncharacterized protein n=1 Tax=Lobosporangium transversale TaxID=64571 RepID=A0A1Y2GJK8_9FUNG|nr:hypothetical protein BCR41DRAFT_356675 [Lobosporangium transversale]ORZ11635.1 hypothetical protein BCR41DRAFT_356675 [Lobosporangium transversale]|eukprot:XP_021879732.1 hypothetical protein BCR41DRAFT_356675 [Lobosporangium transversale]
MHSIFRTIILGIITLALLHRQVSAQHSHAVFWEHSFYGGRCLMCPIYEYNRCYTIDMSGKGLGGVSSFSFFNNDFLKNKFAITFYDNSFCSGNWFRKSRRINPLTGYELDNMAGYNDRVISFKIADYELSNTQGYNEVGEAPTYSECWEGDAKKHCAGP